MTALWAAAWCAVLWAQAQAKDEFLVQPATRPTPAWCAKLVLDEELAKARPPRTLKADVLRRFYPEGFVARNDEDLAAGVLRLEVLVEAYLAEENPQRRREMLAKITGSGVPWQTVAAVLVHGRCYPGESKKGFFSERVALPDLEKKGFDLYFRVPESYEPSRRAYPLILYLPNLFAGEEGGVIREFELRDDVIVASPVWPEAVPNLSTDSWSIICASLANAESSYRIDPDRISVAGSGEGGTAAYNCGLWLTDRLASIGPDFWDLSMPSLPGAIDAYGNLKHLLVVRREESPLDQGQAEPESGPHERESARRRARLAQRLGEEGVSVKFMPEAFRFEKEGFPLMLSKSRTAAPLKLDFTHYLEAHRRHFWIEIVQSEASPAGKVQVRLLDRTKTTIEQGIRGEGVAYQNLSILASPAKVNAVAVPEENRIELKTARVARLTLRLMPGLWTPENPLTVNWNGKRACAKVVAPSIETMLEEARKDDRRDRAILATITLVRP